MTNSKEKSTVSMRYLLILGMCIVFISTAFSQSNSRYVYIKKYKDIAISEMERAGVPASIKLAQGLLESNAGDSYLARKGNNHFGVKCGSKWQGKKVYRKDDDYDQNGKLMESCFRAYKNAEASYIAHSDFLRSNQRYDFLFRLNPYDYKRWARGLKKAGYATSATYAEKLIKVIETYELDQYDRMNANDVIVDDNETTEEIAQGIISNNDVKLVLAMQGDTPQRIADRTNTNLNRLLKYNEEITGPNQLLSREERVYLQPKRMGYRGEKKYHYIQAGESLYEVSQLYGVKEDKLRKRNRIPEGREAVFGEKLKLRGFKINSKEAPKTSKGVNEVNIDEEVIDEERADTRPTKTDDTRPGSTPTRPESTTDTADGNLDLDESAPLTPDPVEERRPVLTSDTGERDETYYPPKNTNSSPSTTTTTTVITPEVPVNTDPVYYPPIPPVQRPSSPTTTEVRVHTVAAGDTLYNISKRYGISVQQLKEWNGLSDNIIRKGQQLRVELN